MGLHGVLTGFVTAGLGAVVSLAPALAAPPAVRPAVAAPASSQIWATREGLVGGVTANGHTIVAHDHFVALPSGKVLSPRGTGQYSVRVCANGRCAYEPVWDTGPWNVADDFWAAPRSGWPAVPAGVPEAQAAYQNGYNGGRDQFGRTVRNPAGIDLADGTMWDGLRLVSEVAPVRVDYLWVEGTRGRISTLDGGPLRVRGGPGTGTAEVGLAGAYARVPIQCQTRGDLVAGAVRTSAVWDRVGPGNYVADAYVIDDPDIHPPAC